LCAADSLHDRITGSINTGINWGSLIGMWAIDGFF
jgi:hypothetical protein